MNSSCGSFYALFKSSAWEVKLLQQCCLGGYDILPVTVDSDLGIHISNSAWRSTGGREVKTRGKVRSFSSRW